MLNLAVNTMMQDQPRLAVFPMLKTRSKRWREPPLSDRAISCTGGSSSVADATRGGWSEAESATPRALELDETEPNLERADFADSARTPMQPRCC